MLIEAYNFFIHPFHASHGTATKVFSTITAIALSILTLGIYLPFVGIVRFIEWVCTKPRRAPAVSDSDKPRLIFHNKTNTSRNKLAGENKDVYQNDLKNREFNKKAPQISHPRPADVFIDTARGADAKFEIKPTSSKTDSSGCFGITIGLQHIEKETIEVSNNGSHQQPLNSRVETDPFDNKVVKKKDNPESGSQPTENELINSAEATVSLSGQESLVVDLKAPKIVTFAELKHYSKDVADSISKENFKEGNEIIVIGGQAFFPSSIASYIRYDGNPVLGASHSLILWKNQSEFLYILSLLMKSRDLEDEDKLCIKEKIEIYNSAKYYIKGLENKAAIKFGSLLRRIVDLMQDGSQGASNVTPNQKLGFGLYYELYNAIPDSIKTFIFPSYAYNPGDNQCIASSGKVFNKQIQRLKSLELIDDADGPLSKEKLKSVLNDLTEKFVEPSVENNEVWKDLPVTCLNVTIHLRGAIFLKIVSLEKRDTPFTSLAYAIYLLGSEFNKNIQNFYTLVGVKNGREGDFLYVASCIEAYQKNCLEEMKEFIMNEYSSVYTELESFIYCLNNESVNEKFGSGIKMRDLIKHLSEDEIQLFIDHPACFFDFMSYQLGWKLPPFLICESSFKDKKESNKDRVLVLNPTDYINPGVLKMGDQFHLVVGFNEIQSELIC